MDTFYTKKGKALGRAYGVMACAKVLNEEKHKPHTHNPQFTIYGPYMCGGFPKVNLYITEPRKPVN